MQADCFCCRSKSCNSTSFFVFRNRLTNGNVYAQNAFSCNMCMKRWMFSVQHAPGLMACGCSAGTISSSRLNTSALSSSTDRSFLPKIHVSSGSAEDRPSSNLSPAGQSTRFKKDVWECVPSVILTQEQSHNSDLRCASNSNVLMADHCIMAKTMASSQGEHPSPFGSTLRIRHTVNVTEILLDSSTPSVKLRRRSFSKTCFHYLSLFTSSHKKTASASFRTGETEMPKHLC